MKLIPKVERREIWAWAMYDFANSGYTTVVITAIFNAYFVAVVAANQTWATLAWTAALACSYILVVFTAPAIGAYADAYAAKKKLLIITTSGCVLGTAGLALAGPNDLILAMSFLVLSNFCFCTGGNLIAAFLPELADDENLGKVSGWGWSLGYLGGLLVLALCLIYVSWAQAEGQVASQFVPITMLITALIFALASLPTFLILRERALPQPHLYPRSVVKESFARLMETIKQAHRYRDMARFLICIVFYQAGIQAVITLAAIYAEQAMGFTTKQTLILIVAVNLTAAVGAFLFGYMQDRLGHLPAIAITLVGWIVMVILSWMAEGMTLFWIAANIAGLCLGASQSASRALIGLLSPIARRAEFYGLWGLATNLSAVLGPITYGMVTWLSHGDHRLAMLITGVYFVLGLLLLLGIDVRRGKRAAQLEN